MKYKYTPRRYKPKSSKSIEKYQPWLRRQDIACVANRPRKKRQCSGKFSKLGIYYFLLVEWV